MSAGLKPVEERGAAGRPPDGSVYRAIAAAEWEPTESSGFWLKRLYEDGDQRTWLMRVDPGAYSPPHAHEGELEQIYVLEGSFWDHERLMRAGDFCCRAPGAVHSAGSDEGAVVLLVYSRS